MKKIVLLCQQCYGHMMELSPARYQLIHELKKRNYQIYVFLPETIRDRKIKDEIFHCTNTAGLSVKEIRNRIKSIAPAYVVGSTYEDTRILYPMPWIMKQTSFVYYNLEIYTPIEEKRRSEGYLNNVGYQLLYWDNKIKEIIFVKQCKLFTIQDNLRKKTSQKYLIKHSNTILIPNSYIFRDEDVSEIRGEGLVYSGELNKLLLDQLVRELHKFPDFAITFSGWNDDWFIKEYKKLQKTHSNIRIYTTRLLPDNYTKFLKQFAVGLIWYTPIEDENINNIGLSSGKFFKHLSLGQPVIVNECPGLGSIVNKFKLGIVIHNVSELKGAYDKIMEKYDCYRNNVIEIYRNKFDFKKVIQQFIKQLEKF